MRTLYDEEFTDLDISNDRELARFTVTDQHVALIVMVNLSGLSGSGGEYAARLFIDNHLVVPDRRVIIEAGRTSVSFQSRDVVVYENGLLTISLKGTINDTNVNGRFIIIDTSTITPEEITQLFDELSTELITSVVKAVADLNVTVRPETKILSPIKKPVTPMPRVIRC